MIKIHYIVSSLVMVMILAGCSDKTNEPTEKNTTIAIDTTDPLVVDTTATDTTDPLAVDTTATDTPIVEEPRRIRERVVEEENNETEVITKEHIPANWYIRLVAEDINRSLKTNLSQLGELEESDAVQQHTLVSGGRFTNPYLDVIFVDPDGVAAGDYKTNYHVYGQGINDSWRFKVITDDVNAEIRLSWNGLYVLTPSLDAQNRIQYTEYRSSTNPLVAKMKLVDSATGTEIPAIIDNDIQAYTFNMDGQVTRSFEWIVYYE